MASRLRTQRLNKILELLHNNRTMRTKEIEKHFTISNVTLRRDLKYLQNSGKILRTFGGAILKDTVGVSHLDPKTPGIGHEEECESKIKNFYKDSIACYAATLIKDRTRVILDSGSTVSFIIPHLSKKEKLVIMTNSLKIANGISNLPSEANHKLMITGGFYNSTLDTFVGVSNKRIIKNYSFDQLFIGADGLDFDRGTVTINEGVNYSKAMASICKEVIVLIESSKIKSKMPKLELAWSKIDVLITDSNIEYNDRKKLFKTGVKKIIFADSIPERSFVYINKKSPIKKKLNRQSSIKKKINRQSSIKKK